ncbi:DNA-binding NarL/FixJ family response regulator [Oxalobacteraceae bacterium GrIS 1.11]
MNILLVDDHALFREGLSMLLHSLLKDVSTNEAGSCEQAFAHLHGGAAVDLILLDLGLPGMSGFDGLAQIRHEFPEIPVVVLSSSEDRASVLRALDNGAMGFVPKSASSGVLEGALKVILAKGIYLPANVFLAERSGVEVRVVEAAGMPPPAVTGVQLGLTPRQIDVLHLVLEGKSSKLICRDLNLSLSTVKTHTSAALRALNVTTRTQAVIAAAKLGLRFAP